MTPFEARFNGPFRGILRWSELEALWKKVKEREGWYAYLVGQTLPQRPLDQEALGRFVEEVDALLKREHDYDYCGIVYVDDMEDPRLIKIYDPHDLGSVCGSSGRQVLPRWVLSRIPPTPLHPEGPMPEGRRRWWQRLFR